MFIKFVSYNFLRPIEVCRLKVEDIDLKEQKLTIKAKNKLVKEKIIPNILIEELSFLSNYNGGDFIFTQKVSLQVGKRLMIIEEIILPRDSKK